MYRGSKTAPRTTSLILRNALHICDLGRGTMHHVCHLRRVDPSLGEGSPGPQCLCFVAERVLLLLSRDQPGTVPGFSRVEVRRWLVRNVEAPEEVEGER